MAKPDKIKRYNPYAFFPQILLNLTFFVVESVLILAPVFIFKKTHLFLTNIYVSIATVVIFAVAETIRRTTILSPKVHYLYIVLLSSVLKELRKAIAFIKTRSAITLCYISLNILFIILILPHIIRGIKLPLFPLESKYSGFMSNTISFSTLTLAIFIAVIVGIIQNISKDFSGAFLKIVITDSIFVSSILIILSLNIGFLSILRYGSNDNLLAATYISACYIIIIFIFLLWLTAYYLSISNIIRATTRRTQKFILKNVLRAAPPLKGSLFLAEVTKKQKLQIWMARWISGSISLRQVMELGIAKREVDSTVIETIENKLRPIGSTLMTGIRLDREEVVTACLKGFESSIRTYVETRKYYIGGIDRFNLFILSQYEAAFKSIIQSPNPHYTEEIAHSAANIGVLFLDLKTITVWGESNDQIGGWTGFLKKLSINTYTLQHTAAPLVAAEHISNIAQRLIFSKLMNTAVYSVNKDLEQLGVYLASSNQNYASIVAGRCISGIMAELHTFLYLSSLGEPIDDLYIANIAESINNIVSSAVSIKSKPDNYDAIVAPLISIIWSANYAPNLTQLTARVIEFKFRDSKAEANTINLLVVAFKRLGWVARYSFQLKTIISGSYTAQSFSEVSYYILKYYATRGKLKRRDKEVIFELLKEVVTSITDGLSFAFKSKDIGNELGKYSAIPALIIFYSIKRGLVDLIDIYRISIEGLIDSFKSIKEQEDPYGHSRREIRAYLQLFGAWLHLGFPESELSNKTKDFLLNNTILDEVTKRRPDWLASEAVRLGYPPGELFADSWFLYPSNHWLDIQPEVNTLLTDIENYKAYYSMINSQQTERTDED